MSKYLSILLGAIEPQFSQLIASFEKTAAGPGVDVRLAAEIRVTLSKKLKELGLDPNDTTAEELYHTLAGRAIQDNLYLCETLKIGANATSVVTIQKLARYFSKSPLVPEIWSLKRTTLKRLLAEHIPHKTMKALRYRSANSMLKRESPASIYAAALLIEGPRYQQTLVASVKKLESSDFELSKIEFVQFAPERWTVIKRYLKLKTVPVYSIPEANAIVIIPADTAQTSTLALLVSALILHEMRRLKEHASYLKFLSLGSNLHMHVRALATEGRIHMLSIQDQRIYWHHIHRVFAHSPEGRSYLEPHVNQDDLDWTMIEASLASIDERLAFWVDTHVVGFASDTRAVSLHLIDVCLNALYRRDFTESGKRFLQEILWDELIVRYMEVPPFSSLLERHMYKLTDNNQEVLYD